ncbi:YndJ family transporter [Spongisporangium articulatum]|uniref:YndJ family transporter n=1 Tax=Spongisporangium articulatum TaxID=3362603 RepID=A0ABW8AKF4_9ACTN
MDDSLGKTALFAIAVVNVLAMVVLVPIGLSLAPGDERRVWFARHWSWVSAPAALSLLLPAGKLAVLLAVPYLVAAIALWLSTPIRDKVLQAATWSLAVAALALVANRDDWELFGFSTGLLALTVAHFHVAGFGALLLLALLARAEPGPLATAAGRVAIGGVVLVAAGFLAGAWFDQRFGDAVELVGAALLTAALWSALALLVHRSSGPDRRAALGLSGLAAVTLVLALTYAAGSAFGFSHPTLDWMVATHGLLNASAVLVTVLVLWVARPREFTTGRQLVPLGIGPERYEAAADALLRWDMHRGAGAFVDPATPVATPGLRMMSRLGPPLVGLTAPCEVLAAAHEPAGPSGASTVMHYETRPGHPFEGDERFEVRLDLPGPDGQQPVWLDVAVRSRPVRVLPKLGGPVVPLAQRTFVRLCARTLRRTPAPSRT